MSALKTLLLRTLIAFWLGFAIGLATQPKPHRLTGAHIVNAHWHHKAGQ